MLVSISAILTYIPKYCSFCGVENNSSDDIIKWGFRKNCIVKIPKVSNCKTRLILHKQRFYCKHCNNTFIAETTLIDRNKNISNNTELQIVEILMFKQSEKDIAQKLDISVSKVDRKLNDIENTFNTTINNGIIEGTNNLIKTIKRIGFGYKRFDHLIARIFLIKGIIKG